MILKKLTGRHILSALALIALAALIILPLVSFADGEDTPAESEASPAAEDSLPESEADQNTDIFDIPPATGVLSRPALQQAEKDTVDVGLSYGRGAYRQLTFTAAEGSMLSHGGDVYKELTFTWEDGVMYCDGVPCQKAYVRSSAPITLSNTGWSYEGIMILTCSQYGITLVNRIPLENYVKGVMSGEIGEDGSYESRKAFSVICRTLVFVARDHGEEFDLCSKNCCQSYRGTFHRNELNDKAVDETAGTVLTYNGVPCLVAYSSSHGYNSCSSFAAWVGADIPYLRVVRYDNEPLDYGGQWEVTYTYEQLSARLKYYTTTGIVRSVSVAETDPYGSTYVYRLKVVDSAGKVSEVMYGGNIMAVLGVRCANFTIQQIPGGITIHGIGNGHGVGYSQRGGHQMGLEGYKWEQILSFYFPGTTLAPCGEFLK